MWKYSEIDLQSDYSAFAQPRSINFSPVFDFTHDMVFLSGCNTVNNTCVTDVNTSSNFNISWLTSANTS